LDGLIWKKIICNKSSHRPHTSANNKLWFTYLLFAVVCCRSKEAGCWIAAIVNVEIFHFSYFRHPESGKFQNLICRQIYLWWNFRKNPL